MNATASTSEDPSARGLIAQAIHANQAHQYALTKYAERLTEELKEIDSLLKAADAEQHEDDAVEEDIQILGAVSAKSPINAHDLLKSGSPFYAEAKARNLYTSYTHSRQMKNRELDALTDAVADEFRRLRAIDHRQRGLGIPNRFEPVDMNGDTKDVDWKIVAEKVSDVATFPRSAEECKVKWLGFKQPRLNHDEWEESEIKRLHEIVKDRQEQGKVDWVEVAQALGTNRVPIDCMRNAIPRPRHLWDPESDKRLVEAVKLYGQNNWSLCARYVSENTNASQCQGRYQRTINPHIRRDGWTVEEDEKIIAAVATYGPSWQEVASFVPGRTNDQCRERYQAALGSVPGRREGLWKPDEDEKLLEAVKIHGHKWKLVSAHMEYTRSVGQCRTHYVKLQKGLTGGSGSRGASAVPNASTSPALDDATATALPSAPAPSAPALPPSPPSAPSDFLILAPPSVSMVPPASTTATVTQELPPKPKPKRKPAKGKGKAKESAPPAAPAESTTATMPMDIDPPTKSTTTTSTSTDPTPSRPRPKPKPVKKAAAERNTPPNASGTEATLDPVPSESAWTVLMLDDSSGNIPAATEVQKDTQGVEQPEQEQDEVMEDEEPTSSAPTRKRGRPRTSTTDPPTQPTTKPKAAPRATVVTGSRQSRRLADKKGGASDT